ncbi:TA system VapC family ribonuclease toxin [Acidicapsa acidisoli]|uniref:TA system VapC family ribonuclease toxin n=1 Tax=Acidicapsa acidisoli TaxID=1615681 RepID=UPI0021E0768E|nr:TA system VapC family ribonuclease toxin [Acidicapsa acidisoli]
MRSSIFPDVNVWLALNYSRHIHSRAAVEWYSAQDTSSALIFCRNTQLGLFRLLSTVAVMADEVLSQPQCWQIFDRWIDSGQATFAQEPSGMESALRINTRLNSPSPKAWADAYLAAFAESANLKLVTFDRALAGQVKGAILLS